MPAPVLGAGSASGSYQFASDGRGDSTGTNYRSRAGAVKEKCLPNPWNAVQLGTTASAADVSWKFVQKETEISNHRKEKEEKAY